MDTDLITEFRHAIRTALISEDVTSQAIITMEVVPRSEYLTFLRIVAFDFAMSQEKAGFGGGDDPEKGGWKILKLPERGAKGRLNPSPWILFMDWLWEILEQNDSNPVPTTGFGDLKVPRNQLSQHGIRARRYGVGVKHKRISKKPPPWSYPPGFDISRDVTITVDSLGLELDEVTNKFNKLITQAKTPDWFYIMGDKTSNKWWVMIDIDMTMPVGSRERREKVDIYKAEHQDQWFKALKKFAAGRVNVKQLGPVIGRYLIKKHGFEYPFMLNQLSRDEFNKAVEILNMTTLDEVIEFGKKEGMAMPPIGPAGVTETEASAMWAKIVGRIANEAGVESYVVDVALSEYMASKGGFQAPFDVTMLRPIDVVKAIRVANKLSFEDIRGMIESVQRHVVHLFGNTI